MLISDLLLAKLPTTYDYLVADFCSSNKYRQRQLLLVHVVDITSRLHPWNCYFLVY